MERALNKDIVSINIREDYLLKKGQLLELLLEDKTLLNEKKLRFNK